MKITADQSCLALTGKIQMSNEIPNPYWNTDWLESQRQYLDAWQAFSQFMPKSPVTGKKDSNPLTEAMEYWWKSVSSSMPEGSTEFVTKMLEQGKVYYILSEQFSKLLKNINKLSKTSEDWQAVLNDQFEEMKKIFIRGSAKEGVPGILGAWHMLPIDTLQRSFSSATLLPGDFLEDLKPESLERATDKFLSIPGVGYTRESQEQAQEGIKLWNNYQKVNMEYNHAMTAVSLKALDTMRMKIIDMAEHGKEINSLREIYDLLVDCGEEAYAEFTHTEVFSDLCGRLTNALMAVKQHGRNIVDEIQSALNMPTRRGMSTLQKRQQDMRRENKETSRKIEHMQDEIAALKKSMPGNGSDTNKKPAATAHKSKINTVYKRKSDKKTVHMSVDKKTAARKKSGKKGNKKDNVIVIKI